MLPWLLLLVALTIDPALLLQVDRLLFRTEDGAMILAFGERLRAARSVRVSGASRRSQSGPAESGRGDSLTAGIKMIAC